MRSNRRLLAILSVVLVLLADQASRCEGHGMLMDPPSRSSAWRAGFQTPINYDDNQLFCGGLDHQTDLDGKCGVCGDAWDDPMPRANEFGGKFGTGTITRKYVRGDVIPLQVKITTSHLGYFEFRVCADRAGSEDCLDQHVLTLLGGTPSSPQPDDLPTRFYPRSGAVDYDIKAQLPDDVVGDGCLLQWHYTAGNNWGPCDNGTGALGCGPQEQFFGCADVSIVDNPNLNQNVTAMRPTNIYPKNTKNGDKLSSTMQLTNTDKLPKTKPTDQSKDTKITNVQTDQTTRPTNTGKTYTGQTYSNGWTHWINNRALREWFAGKLVPKDREAN